VELRDIEIFLVLSEELHFGRTAARVHVSQARVSQSIKTQERRLGGPLFIRSSRAVRLTPLGEQLRADLVPVRDALQQAMQRATLTARHGQSRLRVGLIGDNARDYTDIWNAFRRMHPETALGFTRVPHTDPSELLRLREIDVLITRLPVEEPDLTVGPVVHIEPLVAVMSADHPLAGRDELSIEDFGDYWLSGDMLEHWEDAYASAQAADGRPAGRVFTIPGDADVVGCLYGTDRIDITCAHATRYHVRPDLAYVPLRDSPRIQWALVWRTAAETGSIRGLAEVVTGLGPLVH